MLHRADARQHVVGSEFAGRPPGSMTWEEAMSRTERRPPRHLDDHLGTARRSRGRWVTVAALAVAVVPLILYVRTLTQPTPVKMISVPAPAVAAPVLSDECRVVLAAAIRMVSHADAVEANLRGHKKLMDDYKSGKIDRAAAIPQGSPWRQALARTLQQGAAAADQYDTDKAAYRTAAAQCSNGG
jgi:hypothetical protein